MNSNEVRYKFYSNDTKFYGTMYGGVYGVHEWDKIIEIDKKDMQFCQNADAFYYIWGWPGPDANLYYFKDYGKTWAFNIKDFERNGGSRT